MSLFSKQVSPEIAELIWQGRHRLLQGGRPRPQKLTATVLFTDLEGFSGQAEIQEPPSVLSWLNDYLAGMSATAMEHRGVVKQFVGDSVMAVFGVPFPRTQPEQWQADAVQAVRCALAMERALQDLHARWAAQGHPTLRMRIGIHTGPVVSGILGSGDRQEYMVVGDTVNTASRLESHDKARVISELGDRCCRIFISEQTHQLLGDRFATLVVGTISLKGKTKPITVHAVLGER